MGRRRSKSKFRGVRGPVVAEVEDDPISADGPGPMVTGMHNSFSSIETPGLTEGKGFGAVDEHKTSVYREDSVLSEGDYRKAVRNAVESKEKGAHVTGEIGLGWSSLLRRLLLSRYNPPLQLWWAFIAAEKSVRVENKADPLSQAAALVDFISKFFVSFRALTAVNVSGVLAIAALAPIVALLHEVATLVHKSVGCSRVKDSDCDSVGGKQTTKLLRELKALIREALCFTVVCRRRDFPEFRRLSTLPSVEQSARLKLVEPFHPPFPLASKHMNKALKRESLNSAVIADVVSVELVLLQLVVESINWRSTLKKQNKEHDVRHEEYAEKIKGLARISVYTGSHLSVSEMLLDTLLEKRLPVGNFLDDIEEKLVRECVVEAVLVDPPSFSLRDKADEKGIDLPSLLFMKKLAVGRRAIQTFRAREDRKRADTFSRRIATWETPPQLMKWLQAQKKHLLPLTALLDSQAFLSWVASTFDEVAFTSMLDRCVKAFSSKELANDATNETKDNDHEMEDEEEGDLFFVDTAGDVKDERNVDATADLAFTNAAKDISQVKAERKRKKISGSIYKRLSHGGTGFGKQRGKKIIDELEDVKSDSEGQDSAMVEDHSSAKGSDLPEASSSDDEHSSLHVRKEEDLRKEAEEETPRKVLKGDSTEMVEVEVVAKSVTPTQTESDQMTTEKDVVMADVLDVSSNAVALSKEEVPGESKEGSACQTELDHGRAVESKLVPAIQPTGKDENEGTGNMANETKKVLFEPSGTRTNQAECLVQKVAEASEEGSTKHAEVEKAPVLVTSPTTSVDAVEVEGTDQVMVESSEVATTGKPFSRKKIKSRQNSELQEDQDQVLVESLQSTGSIGAQKEQGITHALASPEIVSSSPPSRRNKRGRKAAGDAADKDSESLEVITSAAAVTLEKERDKDIQIQETPPSVLVTSSETSGKSKRSTEIDDIHMETVDSVISAAPVTAEKGITGMKGPSLVPVNSSEKSSKSNPCKAIPASMETDDCVPFAAPVADEKNIDEQGVPPLSTPSDSVEISSKSKQGKKPTVDEDLQVLQNVVSSSTHVIEKDYETQNVTSANISDVTASKRKRGKNSAINIQRQTVEIVQSPLPVMNEKNPETQAASPLSPAVVAEDPQSKLSKNSAIQDVEMVENAVLPTLVTGDKGYEIEEVGSPSMLVISEETPCTRKRGDKVKASKYRNTVDSDSSAPLQMERDHEIQEAPQSMFLEIPSKAEGDTRVVTADKDARAVVDIPSSAVSDPKSRKLRAPAIDVDQKTEEAASLAALTSSEQTGMTQASAERDLETDVPSASSPTSGKKRGRKPKPRNPDGSLIILPPPTRRIATRGSTPQIVTEKEEERVDEDDIGPVVLVTPHKISRKGRKMVTVEEPQEKVNGVAEVPPLDPAPPSRVQDCQTSDANLIAAVETGAEAPLTSVQETRSRGRKCTKNISDEDPEESLTPSVQATPTRMRKSTRARVVMDNEVNLTPTSTAQATPSKGRNSTRASKAVTDDETDDIQTTPLRCTGRRVRRSNRSRVNTDDETDTTSTPPRKASTGRGEKVAEAKTSEDDDDFEEMSRPKDQGIQNKGRKDSKSRDADWPDRGPPPAVGSPRKRGTGTSQPPDEGQEMNKQAGTVPVFTPRRSKRGAGSSQVKGESVNMALSPYRASKKRKTKVPEIVDLTDDE